MIRQKSMCLHDWAYCNTETRLKLFFSTIKYYISLLPRWCTEMRSIKFILNHLHMKAFLVILLTKYTRVAKILSQWKCVFNFFYYQDLRKWSERGIFISPPLQDNLNNMKLVQNLITKYKIHTWNSGNVGFYARLCPEYALRQSKH